MLLTDIATELTYDVEPLSAPILAPASGVFAVNFTPDRGVKPLLKHGDVVRLTRPGESIEGTIIGNQNPDGSYDLSVERRSTRTVRP